jgi:hypothetical protein
MVMDHGASLTDFSPLKDVVILLTVEPESILRKIWWCLRTATAPWPGT